MHPYRWVIAGAWVVFLLFWGISAIGVKRDVGGRSSARHWFVRIAVFAAVALVALRVPAVSVLLRHPPPATGPAAGWVAAGLAVAGIAIAIWARIHLGANWSSHPAQKVGHELVTTGPYARVRHPIYAGLLLALVGSTLISNELWAPILLAAGVTFLYRIPAEERIMMRLFPDTYPAYRAHTRRLVPFVL